MGHALSGIKHIERLSFLTDEEKTAVLEFARLTRKRFGSAVKEIILFGSKARGDADNPGRQADYGAVKDGPKMRC